jgi:hypothetical protein
MHVLVKHLAAKDFALLAIPIIFFKLIALLKYVLLALVSLYLLDCN